MNEKLKPIQVIAFDADDTLWHNETLFNSTHNKFKALLSPYHSDDWIENKLYETEKRNLKHFGYGVKGFTLSMIETAIDLTEGRISAKEIHQIIGFSKDMLGAPIELLNGVRETISQLATRYRIMLITKGDLFDQETKIARSGLGDLFSAIEIVSEKDSNSYNSIVRKHGILPHQFLMVGNSVKSDVLPVIEMGGQAVHIPYELTWIHERAPADPKENGYHELKKMQELLLLLNTEKSKDR